MVGITTRMHSRFTDLTRANQLLLVTFSKIFSLRRKLYATLNSLVFFMTLTTKKIHFLTSYHKTQLGLKSNANLVNKSRQCYNNNVKNAL